MGILRKPAVLLLFFCLGPYLFGINELNYRDWDSVSFLLVHEAGGHGWARASSAATILATCRRWTYTSALSPGALPLVFPVIFPSRTVIGIIVLYFVAWASIKVSFFTIVATVECFHGV
jgi:hypothetical protein